MKRPREQDLQIDLRGTSRQSWSDCRALLALHQYATVTAAQYVSQHIVPNDGRMMARNENGPRGPVFACFLAEAVTTRPVFHCHALRVT